MSEWLKEHAWKACVGETLPWVRIPLSPPSIEIETGEVPERLNGAVSKTVDRATGPWVRIPPSPPNFQLCSMNPGRARALSSAGRKHDRETDISAHQPSPQADPRLSGAHAHPPRSRRDRAPAPEGPQAPVGLMSGSGLPAERGSQRLLPDERLRRRADYLRCYRSGRRRHG